MGTNASYQTEFYSTCNCTRMCSMLSCRKSTAPALSNTVLSQRAQVRAERLGLGRQRCVHAREPCKFLSIVHEDGAGCSMQQSRSRAGRFCTLISFASRARVVTIAVYLRIKPCMCPHLSSAARCFSYSENLRLAKHPRAHIPRPGVRITCAR